MIGGRLADGSREERGAPATVVRQHNRVNLWTLLTADQDEVLADIQEQLSRLAATAMLVHLAVVQRGDRAITEIRPDQLSASLREAARRSWENGR